MRTVHTESKFTQILSMNDMHDDSKKWLSELALAKDEHQFFEDLLNSTSLDIIAEDCADKFEFTYAVNRSEKQVNKLIGMIKSHENKMDCIGNDKIKVDIYKYEHRTLSNIIRSYKNNFNRLKSQLFDIAKRVKKEEKTRRLINRKDYLNPAF